MKAAIPFTRDDLRRALVRRSILLKDYGSAALVADAMRARNLELAIIGRHDRKPITGERAFSLCFGERLR